MHTNAHTHVHMHARTHICTHIHAHTHNTHIHTQHTHAHTHTHTHTHSGELKGRNHHVFFDNFFTSEKLLEDLLSDGIYACGTARKDRKGFPPTLKAVKLHNR